MSVATDVIAELRAALQALAAALEGGDASAVLAAEPALAASARALTRLDASALEADRLSVRPLLRDARMDLARCIRLGANVQALAAIVATGPFYGRDGLRVSSATPSHVHMRS